MLARSVKIHFGGDECWFQREHLALVLRESPN
jgi:hypothetical protein